MKFNHIINLDNTYPNSKIWLSSDWHLGHKNCIGHAKRPYKDVQENIDVIKKEIEDKVKPEDFLIILGDTIWNSQSSRVINFFSSLPTKNIIYIFGNHDKEKHYKEAEDSGLFLSTGRLEHLKVKVDEEEYEISLSHYPLLCWNGKSRGALMLHGHCHGNLDSYNESVPDLRVDVGWDSVIAKYKLIEIREVIEYFKKKTNGEKFSLWNSNNKIIS